MAFFFFLIANVDRAANAESLICRPLTELFESESFRNGVYFNKMHK